MLDTFRSYAQTKAAKVILALILVPFALFGIDSYLNQAGNNLSIAKVNGYKIALPESIQIGNSLRMHNACI